MLQKLSGHSSVRFLRVSVTCRLDAASFRHGFDCSCVVLFYQTQSMGNKWLKALVLTFLIITLYNVLLVAASNGFAIATVLREITFDEGRARVNCGVSSTVKITCFTGISWGPPSRQLFIRCCYHFRIGAYPLCYTAPIRITTLTRKEDGNEFSASALLIICLHLMRGNVMNSQLNTELSKSCSMQQARECGNQKKI